jgi:aspartyl-tRNA(Asn)/glutamyl-tRNA(Gln) amidotransferase subunit A
MTAEELSVAYRHHTLSPVELLRATLERVGRVDKSLHAFVSVFADAAMADAQRSESRFMADRPLSPLDGVPVGVKDLFDILGTVTGGGSKALHHRPAKSNAWLVRRLAQVGAIPLGKLALDELGVGDSGADSVTDRPKNPWNRDLSPGGSSSGPAVAVAARLCPIAWGTDTGGSVRFPAAWCGVVGLKPTLGSIKAAGCLPLSPTLDHIGPITRSVGDISLVMNTIRRGDRLKTSGLTSHDLSNLRVGVPNNFVEVEASLDNDVRSAWLAVINYFAGRGARISSVALAGIELEPAIYGTIVSAEAFAKYRSLLPHPSELGRSTYRRLLVGAFLTPADHAHAMNGRELFCTLMLEAIKEVDVLILPTAPKPANRDPAGSPPNWLSQSYRHPFNVTGQPAVTVPAGISQAGLPIGIQFVGSVSGDTALLSIVAEYEKDHPWSSLAPVTDWINAPRSEMAV